MKHRTSISPVFPALSQLQVADFTGQREATARPTTQKDRETRENTGKTSICTLPVKPRLTWRFQLKYLSFRPYLSLG